MRIRKNSHLITLRKGKHHSFKLQNDFNKYGESSFSFEVLEIIEEIKKEFIISREQFYLDSLCPEYNVLKKADSRMGIPLSEEAKKKISAARKGKKLSPEHAEKISKWWVGKKHKPETIEKMRKNSNFNGVRKFGESNPFFGKKHNEETKKLLSEKKKGKKLSKEHRLKFCDNINGERNPFYGKKHSIETKQKIREAKLGKKLSDETKAKLKGRKASVEARKKMSEFQSKRPPRSKETLEKMRQSMLKFYENKRKNQLKIEI
jgi:group I intron endonuclease